MLGRPLHPMVVHFPIALYLLGVLLTLVQRCVNSLPVRSDTGPTPEWGFRRYQGARSPGIPIPGRLSPIEGP